LEWKREPIFVWVFPVLFAFLLLAFFAALFFSGLFSWFSLRLFRNAVPSFFATVYGFNPFGTVRQWLAQVPFNAMAHQM
jgi:hypothetical protein